MGFRQDINGLRAIAVLLVLLFHFGVPGLGAGFIGVDVFFVISGFLMTSIIVTGLEKRNFSILGFYRARLFRLYPALFAMVLATLAFGLFFVEPVALEGIARHGLSALLFISNVVFWRSAGYFGASADTMWMLHTWSLSVEWQFYLIYPVVLALATRFMTSRRALFALLLAGFIPSLVFATVLATAFPNDRLVSAGFYLLPSRAWEMLAGGLVFLWPLRRPAWSPRAMAAVEATGIALILSCLLLISEATPWPSYAALLPVAGTMLVLGARAPNTPLAFPPLQWIGTGSYSIYLWHWPLVAAIAYLDLANPAITAIAFALSLLAGWASYRFIEQPSRIRLQNLRGLGVLFKPGAAALAGIAACVVVMLSHGLPQRDPAIAGVQQESLAAAADYQFPLSHCEGTTTFGTALKPCAIGKASADRDVLILGDSFAQVWYPRVAALESDLADHAVVFITKGGCPPIEGLDRVQSGFGCASFHRMAMDLARDQRFGTVILAGMWTAYFTKDRSNATIEDQDGQRFSSGSKAGLDAALANLAREIDELQQLGKKVVVLKTTPYPNIDIPAALRRRAFAGGPLPTDWSFDFKSTVMAKAEPIDDSLSTLSSHGATVINVARLLCGDMVCPAARDAQPLYIDAAHLRSNYAASVGTFLDPFIR